MTIKKLLIANRGEIAIRISRAADELAIATVAVHAEDDADSLHVRRADEVWPLNGSGPRAYLDIDQIVAAAVDAGCDAVHPGYGFLSENPALARACEAAGVTFVGPQPEALELFGDKARARELAESHDVPVLAGSGGPTALADAEAFYAGLGDGAAMMIKAVSGGGGRGMRLVTAASDVADAFERCTSEARQSFGNGDVYVEQFLTNARHIEVQIVGDSTGQVAHLGERECSIQRQHQKIVEIAPCPDMTPALRTRLCDAALRLASAVGYQGLGTFEFLVDADRWGDDAPFAFIEANARLQVEHTVTEAVTGVDLVALQLQVAGGTSLVDAGVNSDSASTRGHAVQTRVNLETLLPDGTTRPSGGTIAAFDIPSGPGVRVDTYGYTGYRTNPRYDSLLAKVIVHHPSDRFADVLARTSRALNEFRIDGTATNLATLDRVVSHPDIAAGRFHTRFVDEHLAELIPTDDTTAGGDAPSGTDAHRGGRTPKVDAGDPLAVLAYGKGSGSAATSATAMVDAPSATATMIGPPGTIAVEAPLLGTIVSISVEVDQSVAAESQVIVLEAMKMEHVVTTPTSGIVRALAVDVGDTIAGGDPLLFIEEADVDADGASDDADIDLDAIRDDLSEVIERHNKGLDEHRPDAVERRRKTGQRTARENVNDLCDAGTWVEYGPLAVASQRSRHSIEHLIERTPADGLVGGIGAVNGEMFGDERNRCVVASYDYTVLAGTQGWQNHRKKDRLFEIAERQQLPVVLLAEGGGGRPGDTDAPGVAGLDCLAFGLFGKLSGLVPLVGITSGRCFAGNAALLGSCDVIIATEGSNIGMGGPAMVEGGGLGVFRPEDIGPLDVQTANGVVDIAVENEAEAVEAAKQYLSYFQGPVDDWACADQRLLRHAIPENRLRVYDIRNVVEMMCDTGSVLELRRSFGHGMVTSLARVEGRPVGVIANNPVHLGGAIDADAADKAVRFMQLCDAFDIPLLFLCDTPGIMVGPESETTANVRHAARMFVNGANLTVPFFTIVLRKGYGLGAQAMAGGSFHAPLFTVAWPTGEFGGMGLEGAVKLGFRNELAAIDDPDERKQRYDEMVEQMYKIGKATNMASHFEIDGVIDPLESRHWITSALATTPPVVRTGKKRPCVDTW